MDKTDMLKISVITVCLNSVKTIEQTIRSVIMQDYNNIEYIIVDGGSTDGTVNIIRKYEDYLSGWISEPDKGIYDAMNKGVSMARGDVIAFLNSGDWYKEGIIKFVANDISDSKSSISCYDVDVFDGTEIRECGQKLAEKQENIRICMTYCHQAVFAKRCLFEEFGKFNTAFSLAGDYEWILRMYNNEIDIKYKAIAVANFREGGISSLQGNKTLKEMKVIAISALNGLMQDKKISKEYFEEMYDKILIHYEKSELNYMAKSAIMSQLIMKNDKLRNSLRENILKKSMYSIFGCGFLGEECMLLLKQLGLPISNFWDNNPQKWGTCFRNIDIKPPQEIEKGENIIIICSFHSEEISTQLCGMGLTKDLDFIDYNMIRKNVGMIIKKLYPHIITE